MKRLFFGALAAMLLVVATMVVSVSAKSVAITVPYNQAQFQWRGISSFGNWTPGYSYLNDPETFDFTLTGQVLHTSWSYSPLVTDLAGASTIYNYDAKSDLWVEKEGTVSYQYVPGYGNYPIANYFRGYLSFSGTPSATSFLHGVAYQWVYLLAPQDATLTAPYTAFARWDETAGAWLVGFSIYLWDPASTIQTYTTPFPSPFIEPVPANLNNQLGL